MPFSSIDTEGSTAVTFANVDASSTATKPDLSGIELGSQSLAVRRGETLLRTGFEVPHTVEEVVWRRPSCKTVKRLLPTHQVRNLSPRHGPACRDRDSHISHRIRSWGTFCCQNDAGLSQPAQCLSCIQKHGLGKLEEQSTHGLDLRYCATLKVFLANVVMAQRGSLRFPHLRAVWDS